MNTLFLLMAQYDARAIVPAETVCRDYFSHLTLAKFLRKIGSGDINLPLTRSERSQKSARGVHIQDLAEYLDRRRAVALSEARAFKKVPEVEAKSDLGDLANCRINANDVHIL